MAKDTVITQKDFDALLYWLASDREAAGQKYEKIRERLIRIFIGRGCFEAEELADLTINRVTLKLPKIIGDYVGEPTLYFYGVANRIHLEWLRKQSKIKHSELIETHNYSESEAEIESESEYECLEDCLKTLGNVERELIVDYYREEKRTKIELRRELAEKFKISIGALQVKTCRIRASLQKCVQNCVGTKSS
jgi:RNA polymerase sigma factor (sigma-70 family)